MAKLTRIPLDIVVTATGERTSGKLVAVMADDLDALERDAGVVCVCTPSDGCDEEGDPGCQFCRRLDPEEPCPADPEVL